MRHRCHDGICTRQVVKSHQPHAVLVHRLFRLGLGVGHEHLDAVGLEFVDDVDHLGVAQVAAVLLEGQAQHVDAGALDVAAAGDHLLDGLLGDELAHAVVDAPAGQDDLRVVAQHVGLVGEVVGVHADAVAAHQARLELQEVPLRAGRLKHLGGVDAELVEDDGQLIHQRDVQVALGVLDHLGGLGGLDAGGAVHAGHDDLFVDLGHLLQRLGRVAGDDLQDLGQRVFLVARVDALGAVADEEVLLPFQAGLALQHRDADLFGGAGVDGALIDDDRALLHVAADAGGRADQRAEVGDVGLVHRSGHSHDDDVGLGQHLRVVGVDRVGGGLDFGVAQFTARVGAALAGLDLVLRDVEADGAHLLAELHHQRQAHVAEADDCERIHGSFLVTLKAGKADILTACG
mmetsp:Transcript_39155/g.91820  ORF Transcript_39155/g.91820 Transcript_39155/m.91820 type:complete len:403 (+) Transcript_39155:568-1776(+)